LLLAGQYQDDANAHLFIVKTIYLKNVVSGDANISNITLAGTIEFHRQNK